MEALVYDIRKTQKSSLIEWSVAATRLPGQKELGDLYLVEPTSKGVLVAVIDGLGHGRDAAVSAEIAVSTLKNNLSAPVTVQVNLCHEKLKGQRGAVLSIASFSPANQMTWVGVGNVEGILFKVTDDSNPSRESLLTLNGVVGYQMPSLHTSNVNLARGDTLILATDGIRSEFASEKALGGLGPSQIVEKIISIYSKGTDDALVLAARYVWEES